MFFVKTRSAGVRQDQCRDYRMRFGLTARRTAGSLERSPSAERTLARALFLATGIGRASRARNFCAGPKQHPSLQHDRPVTEVAREWLRPADAGREEVTVRAHIRSRSARQALRLQAGAHSLRKAL